MRTVPWFGPLVADSLRAVVGGERVTALEEAVASVEDHVARVTTDGRARSLEEATPAALLDMPSTPNDTAVERALAPSAVQAPYTKVAAAGDGTWSAVPTRLGETPFYRTMLHPNPERAYAELFVFALDLSRFELHAVAGSVEPRSSAHCPASNGPASCPRASAGGSSRPSTAASRPSTANSA